MTLVPGRRARALPGDATAVITGANTRQPMWRSRGSRRRPR